MTWKAVGAKYGISAGMAYRIAVQGYRPASRAIRSKLPTPPRKPRRKWKREALWLAGMALWLAGRERP